MGTRREPARRRRALRTCEDVRRHPRLSRQRARRKEARARGGQAAQAAARHRDELPARVVPRHARLLLSLLFRGGSSAPLALFRLGDACIRHRARRLCGAVGEQGAADARRFFPYMDGRPCDLSDFCISLQLAAVRRRRALAGARGVLVSAARAPREKVIANFRGVCYNFS